MYWNLLIFGSQWDIVRVPATPVAERGWSQELETQSKLPTRVAEPQPRSTHCRLVSTNLELVELRLKPRHPDAHTGLEVWVIVLLCYDLSWSLFHVYFRKLVFCMLMKSDIQFLCSLLNFFLLLSADDKRLLLSLALPVTATVFWNCFRCLYIYNFYVCLIIYPLYHSEKFVLFLLEILFFLTSMVFDNTWAFQPSMNVVCMT